jgi:predicted permease
MSIVATFRCWWKAIVHRSRTSDEIEAEAQFHMEDYAADLMRSGMPEEEARRTARVDFGPVDLQREKYREAIGLRVFDEASADIRYGLRALLRNPGFSTVAILSLTLGIGATTAMFSLIYAVLLHPFPYAASDRIVNPVVINEQHPEILTWFAMTAAQSEVFRKASCIESILGFTPAQMEVTGGSLPDNAFAIYLTENADEFFGVRALIGRSIQPSDARGHQAIAVLNYRFWQSHYGGDPAVVGRNIQLDHRDYTIVGVMPRSFAFNNATGPADIYLPRNLLDFGNRTVTSGAWLPWIRLRKNISPSIADQQLDAIVHQFAKEVPAHYPKQFHVQLQPIILPFQQSTSRTLYLLLAGVLLLLLIGCANCSILLLARGAVRRHELAIRTALGASRWRIVRQLLVESLVLSFSGAILGVGASYWLAQLPIKLSPTSFPAESIIRLNLPILAFSVGLALTCGILFGLSPALHLSRGDLARGIQARQRSIAGHRGNRRVNTMIAGQIALTLLLMATAGTAIGVFLHLMHVPLGYDPHNVLEAGIVMHWSDPAEWNSLRQREGRVAFVEQIRRKIESIPGVLSAAVAIDVYPPNGGDQQAFEILDKSAEQGQQARTFPVSPEFFATLRIPVFSGRIWNETENLSGDGVAVVNQSFARRYWPHANAIGQQIRMPELISRAPLLAASPGSSGWRTVIGVVGDARDDGLDRPVLPAIYFPYTTLLPPYVEFHVRTNSEPLGYLHSIREAVSSISSEQQIANGAYDLETGVATDAQWSRERLFSLLFGFFSGMALLLALIGLFSVVAYSVAQRTTEFGVRLALGASRRHVLWVATRAAVFSLAIGLVFGSVADLLVEKLLSTWMNSHGSGFFGLPAADLLLGCCAVLACLLAAWRAASIEPTQALRCE